MAKKEFEAMLDMIKPAEMAMLGNRKKNGDTELRIISKNQLESIWLSKAAIQNLKQSLNEKDD